MRMAAALACALVALPGVARADSCSVTGSGLSFGVYDLLANADLPGSGNIVVQCNQDNTVQLALSAGSSGTSLNRVMRGVSRDTLAYNVYTDATRAVVWTDTRVVTVAVARGWTPSTVYVYGKIFAGQDAGAGTYGDTLSVTVNF